MGEVIKFPVKKEFTIRDQAWIEETADAILLETAEILKQVDEINEQTEALIRFMESKEYE